MTPKSWLVAANKASFWPGFMDVLWLGVMGPERPVKEPQVMLSPHFRDLSKEFGIVVETPLDFYPQTTEEPNATEELFREFMTAVMIDVTSDSGLVLESRERYNPSLDRTGGGAEYVGELIRFSVENWRDIATITGLLGLFFPDQFKAIGARITAAIAAIRFSRVWRKIAAARQVTVKPPTYLQPTLEGLCLLDAMSSRTAGETDFRILSVTHIPNALSSARRPSGAEEYEISIASDSGVYTYFVSGAGQGAKEVRGRAIRVSYAVEANLVATNLDALQALDEQDHQGREQVVDPRERAGSG